MVPVRLFYSYAEEDMPLLRELEGHLSNLRRQGFLAEWHRGNLVAGQVRQVEVAARLTEAEIVLLLLSADFLARDACYLGDLQTALRRQQEGLARILPVLLRPTELQGSPLCALQRLPRDGRAISQHTDRDQAWTSIAEQLHDVIRELRGNPPATVGPGELPHPDSRYQRLFHIHRLRDERRALPRLLYPGTPVVLQGPNHAGKRWLLDHLLELSRKEEPNVRIVRISLPELPPESFSSLDTLLQAFGRKVLGDLKLGEQHLATVWAQPGLPQDRLGALLRQNALPSQGRLLLALLRIERLRDCAYRHDVFALLRSWAERREDPWSRLRILCTLAIEPMQLDATDLTNFDTSSFFNLGAPIRLGDFDREDLAPFATLHGLSPSPAELDLLWSLLHGHPYLSHLALYEAAQQQQPLATVLVDPESDDSIFAHYLRSQWHWLEQQRLLDTLRSVAVNPGQPVPVNSYCRLYSQGLLIKEGRRQFRVRPPLLANFIGST